MNQLCLQAFIIERDVLRYTPAGLPALNFKLMYEGEVIEAGLKRKLMFEMVTVALGDVAMSLDRVPLNTHLICEGFLAKKTRLSKMLEFHVTAFSEQKN